MYVLFLDNYSLTLSKKEVRQKFDTKYTGDPLDSLKGA